MAKGGNRKLKTVYPDEREGRVKDANKKLKAQVNSLKKQLRQAQEDVTTLRRAFNKSCNYIQHEHNNYSLEEVIEMVNSFGYKETERGRQAVLKEVIEVEEFEDNENFELQNCPKCGKNKEEGFMIMDFGSFNIIHCKCGHRTRIQVGEGIEGN